MIGSQQSFGKPERSRMPAGCMRGTAAGSRSRNAAMRPRRALVRMNGSLVVHGGVSDRLQLDLQTGLEARLDGHAVGRVAQNGLLVHVALVLHSFVFHGRLSPCFFMRRFVCRHLQGRGCAAGSISHVADRFLPAISPARVRKETGHENQDQREGRAHYRCVPRVMRRLDFQG